MRFFFCILLIISLFCFHGCKENKAKEPDFVRIQQSDKPEKEDPYLKWNQMNVGREDEDIDFFTRRYGWNVERTGTGLRYESIKEGSGQPVQTEDVVTLEYTTCLLSGDTVYSSRKDGLKTFKVDKSDEIMGLHEAVKKMKKGGKAHLVVPSFLAYGVAGDGRRIRGKVSLAMTIEVVDIERNKN